MRPLVFALALHAIVAAVIVVLVLLAPRQIAAPEVVVLELVAVPAPAPRLSPPPMPERTEAQGSPAPMQPASAESLYAQMPQTADAATAATSSDAGAVATDHAEQPATQLSVAAAAPPTFTSQPQLVTEPSPDEQRLWESEVLLHLEKRKQYPAVAQRNGEQDHVLLRIRVDRSGTVLNQRVVQSAGVALLDQEAMDLVRRSNPLPPPPAALDERELDFLVAVDFHIEQGGAALW